MLRWYKVAADANNTEGMYLLGWAHHRGIGTDRNISEAVRWYRLAIRTAGKLHWPKQVAPTLGLWAIRLDDALRPLLGEDATQRAAEWLQRNVFRMGRSYWAEEEKQAARQDQDPQDATGDPRDAAGEGAMSGGGDGPSAAIWASWVEDFIPLPVKQWAQDLAEWINIKPAKATFNNWPSWTWRQAKAWASAWSRSESFESDVENLLAFVMLIGLSIVLGLLTRQRLARDAATV